MKHTGRHFLQIPGPTNVPERVEPLIAPQLIIAAPRSRSWGAKCWRA